MHIPEKQILQILARENYITEDDAKRAQTYQDQKRGSSLEYLLREHLVSKDLVGQALAEHFKLPYADLNTNQPVPEQVRAIPETLAKKARIVIFKEHGGSVILATDDPDTARGAEEKIQELFTQTTVSFAYALTEDIEAAFSLYRTALNTRFVEIIKKQKRIAPEIIEEIIADALSFRASDIHFEPQENELIIRFRIDGILQEAGRIDKQFYENILNRVKVLAHLRTDEHDRVQDGAIRYRNGDRSVDLRISIAPTLDGEKVVIRVLSEYARGFTLQDVGLSEINQNIVRRAINKPYGMIIVSGPTGSGKTTTMYSILKILNRPEINIATIEDPVEYKLANVNHMQVNDQTGLTFAKGLKSIVRQDPDIILVGEIRDAETSEIAINAALTGHLLLTTFHANDAATAIPRLIDMGAEPFLLASTLQLLIAQRLVRTICERCRSSYNTSRSDIASSMPHAERFFDEKNITLYRGTGCALCHGSGFKGRTALFECIQVTPAIQKLILKKADTAEINATALTEGSVPMFLDGIEKVKAGLTTLEEVIRVVPIPD